MWVSNTNPLLFQCFKFQNMWYTGLVYYDIYASVVCILQFPNTSSPRIAGFVSWTAASSVFICLVKLLPLAVTMVTIPPGSVACRGARRTSLCWTLWRMWIMKFIVYCEIYLKTRLLARPFLTHQKVSWWWRLWNWPLRTCLSFLEREIPDGVAWQTT